MKETEFFRATSEKNSTAKNLHPQVNNKVLSLTEEERRIVNYGPKFVPSNSKQALDRLRKRSNCNERKSI